MRFETHTVISAVTPAGVMLAAGRTPTLGFVVATTAAGVAIDVLDHPIYQLRFGRRDPELRGAWRLIGQRRFRDAAREFQRIEDSRSINRLVFHSRGGLLAASLAAVVLSVTTGGVLLPACALVVLLAMHCDIVSDIRTVGHVNNWFGRATMRGTRADGWLEFVVRRGKLLLAALHAPFWFTAGDLFFEAARTPRTGMVLLVHVGMSVVAAYLSALGVAASLAYRQAAGPHRRFLAPTAGRIEWMIVNHVAVAAATAVVIAGEVPLLVMGAPHLPSSWSDTTVAMAAAGVVLLTSLLVVYLVHSTGGALGGLAGAVVGVWLDLIVHGGRPDHERTLQLAATLVVVLLGWALGLVFMSMPGRRVSSAVVMSVSTTPDGDAFARLVAAVIDVHESVAADLGGRARPVIRTGEAEEAFDLSTWRGDVLLSQWESVWSPMRRRCRHALWPTVTAGKEAGDVPPPKTAFADGVRRVTFSEILDDLMTRRSVVETQLLVPTLTDDGRAVMLLRVYEGTSTKGYATGTCERVAREVAERMTDPADDVLVGVAKFERICPYQLTAGDLRRRHDDAWTMPTPRVAATMSGVELLRPAVRRGPQWRLGAVALQTVTVLGGVASVAALLPSE